MLVSAVLDPGAFEDKYFDKHYRIQVASFLRGIRTNGLLILDSEERLQTALTTKLNAVGIKYRQELQILLEELIKKGKRVVSCPVSSHSTKSLLDLGYDLRTDTGADALIVGADSLKTLMAAHVDVVLLDDYYDSPFEKDRQQYVDGFGPIGTLPRKKVDELIIRAIRFSKWLRFYDPFIGAGHNTNEFRKGIEYILSLWKGHGLFASQRDTGTVDIFTRSARRVLASDSESVKRSKRLQNRAKHQIVVRDLLNPVKRRFPSWPVKLHVKNDAKRIFHARYLQTEHAIIRVDPGFDFFIPGTNDFKPSLLLTLNMAESSHLQKCRDLPKAAL